MLENKARLNIRSGLLSLSVILLINGCATNPNPNKYEFDNPLTIDPPRGPVMYINDLQMLRINDCENKDKTVALLQSMRRTKVEIMKAQWSSFFKPVGPIASERHNWWIDQKLIDIRNYCHKKL